MSAKASHNPVQETVFNKSESIYCKQLWTEMSCLYKMMLCYTSVIKEFMFSLP